MVGAAGPAYGRKMRVHFTICQKRPAASDHVDRRGRNPKAKCGRPLGTANTMRLALRSAVLLSIWLSLAVARALLAVALACQDRFDSLLLTWFQIESVPLNFFDDFLLQNLALEAA
jgi:hypothetical protein